MEELLETIKNGAEQLMAAGFSINETIQKIGEFMESQGLDKEAQVRVQCYLKMTLDQDFFRKYSDWVYNKING